MIRYSLHTGLKGERELDEKCDDNIFNKIRIRRIKWITYELYT